VHQRRLATALLERAIPFHSILAHSSKAVANWLCTTLDPKNIFKTFVFKVEIISFFVGH